MPEALLIVRTTLCRRRRCLRGVSEQRLAITGNLDGQTESQRRVAFLTLRTCARASRTFSADAGTHNSLRRGQCVYTCLRSLEHACFFCCVRLLTGKLLRMLPVAILKNPFRTKTPSSLLSLAQQLAGTSAEAQQRSRRILQRR